MVSSHSLKHQARQLVAQANGRINYTQALAFLHERRNFDLRSRVTEANRELCRLAGELLPSRDIIVVGGAGSGKTTALHLLMDSLSNKPRVFADLYGNEWGVKSEDPSYRILFSAEDSPQLLDSLAQVELLAIDEVRRPVSQELSEAFEEKSLVVGVHSQTPSDALLRLNQLVVRDWRNPAFLVAQRDPRDNSRQFLLTF